MQFASIALVILAGIFFSTSFRTSAGDGAAGMPPAQGELIDEIRAWGKLRVATIAEFPWLNEQQTLDGKHAYSGPAWTLASEYAKRIGVPIEAIPVANSEKVSIVKAGGPTSRLRHWR